MSKQLDQAFKNAENFAKDFAKSPMGEKQEKITEDLIRAIEQEKALTRAASRTASVVDRPVPSQDRRFTKDRIVQEVENFILRTKPFTSSFLAYPTSKQLSALLEADRSLISNLLSECIEKGLLKRFRVMEFHYAPVNFDDPRFEWEFKLEKKHRLPREFRKAVPRFHTDHYLLSIIILSTRLKRGVTIDDMAQYWKEFPFHAGLAEAPSYYTSRNQISRVMSYMRDIEKRLISRQIKGIPGATICYKPKLVP